VYRGKKLIFYQILQQLENKNGKESLLAQRLLKIKTNFRASPTNDARKIQPEGPRGTG
jgi:hypothetical protein